MQLTLHPWAKVNLYLKILGKRQDGYHELLTVLHSIALFDDLIIKKKRGGLRVICKDGGLPLAEGIPQESDNIVTRAARLFFASIGEEPAVEISLIKRIPIGGGLGGGSSDAVSALLGLNQLFASPLGKDTLRQLGIQLGMDTSFFWESGLAICSGRGEIIEKRYSGIEFWCVLVNPGTNLATKRVYQALNLPLTEQGTKDIIHYFDFAAPSSLDYFGKYIYNDLENVAIELCPAIGEIKDVLKDSGAEAIFVSGSGATVCGLAKTKQKAEEVMKKVVLRGSSKWWMRVVSSLLSAG